MEAPKHLATCGHMSSFKNLPIYLTTDPGEDIEKEHLIHYKTVTFLFFYVENSLKVIHVIPIHLNQRKNSKISRNFTEQNYSL